MLKELNKIYNSLLKIESNLDVVFFTKEELEKIDDDKIEIDDDFLKELNNDMISELKYYGFAWETNIQKSGHKMTRLKIIFKKKCAFVLLTLLKCRTVAVAKLYLH